MEKADIALLSAARRCAFAVRSIRAKIDAPLADKRQPQPPLRRPTRHIFFECFNFLIQMPSSWINYLCTTSSPNRVPPRRNSVACQTRLRRRAIREIFVRISPWIVLLVRHSPFPCSKSRLPLSLATYSAYLPWLINHAPPSVRLEVTLQFQARLRRKLSSRSQVPAYPFLRYVFVHNLKSRSGGTFNGQKTSSTMKAWGRSPPRSAAYTTSRKNLVRAIRTAIHLPAPTVMTKSQI